MVALAFWERRASIEGLLAGAVSCAIKAVVAQHRVEIGHRAIIALEPRIHPGVGANARVKAASVIATQLEPFDPAAARACDLTT